MRRYGAERNKLHSSNLLRLAEAELLWYGGYRRTRGSGVGPAEPFRAGRIEAGLDLLAPEDRTLVAEKYLCRARYRDDQVQIRLRLEWKAYHRRKRRALLTIIRVMGLDPILL